MRTKLTAVGLLFAVLAVCAAIAVLAVRQTSDTKSNEAPPRLQVAHSGRKVELPLASSQVVRVSLTDPPRDRLTLAVDGPYRIRRVGGPAILERGERMTAAVVVATSTGLRIGRTEYAEPELEIIAEDPPAIWVGEHQYRGTVRLYREGDRTIVAVNVVPLEHYVAAVTDSEMPAAFPDAARKAQAIVARTYALYEIAVSRGHPQFDLFATTRSQKYLGFQYRTPEGRRLAGETADGRRIARETAGMICTYRDKLFCTYYSAVCGGRTTLGRLYFSDAAPPLTSVPCRWCAEARLYRWKVELPRTEASRAVRHYFAAQGMPFGSLAAVRESRPGSKSRLAEFEVADARRRRKLAATEFRKSLGRSKLPSARFTVREAGEELVFEGRGHGHGVGLCQWGARGQALAGRTCLEILEHYYPGAEVVRVRL